MIRLKYLIRTHFKTSHEHRSFFQCFFTSKVIIFPKEAIIFPYSQNTNFKNERIMLIMIKDAVKLGINVSRQ